MTTTDELATFVREVEYEALPDEIIEETKTIRAPIKTGEAD